MLELNEDEDGFCDVAAGRLFHRDVHARAGAFVTGIGQERQVLQVWPRPRGSTSSRAAVRSWVLPGSTSEPHSGTPPRGGQGLRVPAGSWAWPECHLAISLPFLLVFLSAQRSEEIGVPSRMR